VIEVFFQESEPGVEPYVSRYLLSDRYLRLDDGTDNGDFILFDLEQKVIHSFQHGERTHIKISPAQPEAVDFQLDFDIEQRTLTEAPKINGESAVEYRLLANGELCKKVVSVQNLMPEFVAALKGYEKLLANQASLTLSQVPEEYRTGCYMANNYLHSEDYLQGGFPLSIEDDRGRSRKLLDFSRTSKPGQLFALPQGYQLYKPGQVVE
jgi:hypothetical protein